MVYGLPTDGEPNWGAKVNASIEAVKTTADAAETEITGRLSEANLAASTGTEFQVQTSFGSGATDAASMTATTTHIQGLIDLANALSVAVRVPYGHYVTNAVIEDVQRLILDGGPTIEAGVPGMAAVLRTRLASRLDGGFLAGSGHIKAGANADLAVHVRNFWNFRIAGVHLRGGAVAGIKAGDSGANRSAEIVMSGTLIHHDATIVSGSRGILVENSGDHQFSQVIVNGYDIGVDLGTSGSNVLADVHVWSDPAKGVTSECFRDFGNGNMYVTCHADTPGTYGYHFGAYNAQMISCKTTTPSNSPVADGVVTAIKFDQTDPYASIVGHHFTAAAGKRFAKDIDVASLSTVQVIGLTDNGNIVTKATTEARLTGLRTRDPITSGQGFRADSATPLAGLGVRIRTAGLDRWTLGSDGVAESGANAGSGLLLSRYDDAGTKLGDVFYVARTGTWVQYSNVLYGPNAGIIPDGTNGLKIATNAAQKLGFWGAAPVAQPQTAGVTAGFTAGAGAAVDSAATFTGNYGTTAYTISDLVSNLKQAGILKS